MSEHLNRCWPAGQTVRNRHLFCRCILFKRHKRMFLPVLKNMEPAAIQALHWAIMVGHHHVHQNEIRLRRAAPSQWAMGLLCHLRCRSAKGVPQLSRFSAVAVGPGFAAGATAPSAAGVGVAFATGVVSATGVGLGELPCAAAIESGVPVGAALAVASGAGVSPPVAASPSLLPSAFATIRASEPNW